MAPAFTNALAVVPPRIEILCLKSESLRRRIKCCCGTVSVKLMEAEDQVADESFLVMVWRSKWAE